MVDRVWMIECHYCGDRYYSPSFNGLCKYNSVYRKKSVNPLDDELADFGRMPKYRGFCNDECAEKYFTEIDPSERAFYKKIKPRKNG